MDIGPVEFMVIAFPGNRFKGEIAPALIDLVDEGTINIVDFAFVHRDEHGEVTALEVEQEDSAVVDAFAAVTAERGGLINDDDLHEIADALDNDSSAMVIVWEDLWAARLATAIRDAGGVVADNQRIPHEVVQAAIDYAEANGGAS